MLPAHFLQICYIVLCALCEFEIVCHWFELFNIVIIDNGNAMSLLSHPNRHINKRGCFNYLIFQRDFSDEGQVARFWFSVILERRRDKN
jgi:hypothetical protein